MLLAFGFVPSSMVITPSTLMRSPSCILPVSNGRIYFSKTLNPTPFGVLLPLLVRGRNRGWSAKRSRKQRNTKLSLGGEIRDAIYGLVFRSTSSDDSPMAVKEGMESDEEVRRVPEFGGEQSGPTTSRELGSTAGGPGQAPGGEASKRKRGKTPADKEHRRLKRLLRNRVSAQQARERKKAYLIELEGKVKELEKRNSELEEKLSTSQKETQMLRHILKNTTVGRKGPNNANRGIPAQD